jgi:Na+/melibiose symporter-like transporter
MTFDPRKYARQTTFRLILGGILIIFIIGIGLIYLIYGPGAAMTGLICLGAGMGIIFIILIIFWVMDRIVKRANEE